MAIEIKVVGNNQYDFDNVKMYGISLALFDGDNMLHAKFNQTESLTNAFAGITDFGAMVFNDANSDMSATVTIEAVAEDGTDVTADITLTALKDKAVGDTL